MSEGHLRLVSLSIRGGPLHGRRHNPDEVVAEVLIGSDPDCHLVVELPGISPIHAKIWADLNESTVYDTSAPLGVYVNSERVTDKAKIGEGDMLWLGPPQQPESVCVQLHFEPWVEVLPGAPVYDASEAVVIEDEAPSTQAVTAGTAAGQADEAAPVSAEPMEVEAVEAVEVEPVVDVAAVVGSAPAEPPAAAAADDDPFFVGEAAAVVPSPRAPAAPSPAAAAAAPAAAPADDWAISTEEPAADSLAEPMPVSADEFFVAGDPEPSNPSEPNAPPPPVFAESPATFVDAEPIVEPQAPSFDLPPLEPPPSIPTPAPPRPPSPPAPAPAKAKAPATPQPKPAPRPAPAEPKPARAEPAAEPKAEPKAEPAPAAKPRTTPAPRAAEPQAARPAAAPRPAAARRPAGAPAARAATRRPAAGRSRGGGAPAWLKPAGLGLAGLLVVGAAGFTVSRLFFAAVRLDAVEPARVRVGQRATIIGSGFGKEPGAQTVVFGDREAKVLQASPERLDVEVPEAVTEAGAESRVSVVVRARGRTSGVVDVTVFQGPRLHGISPGAAMPGEEVMLAGAGWGIGAAVRFGAVPATILEVQPTLIRAVVPELPGGSGTEAPVVVSVGGIDSNQAPFIVGHLPVLSGTNPTSVAPGDIVSLAGRGFDADPARNDVRVGGVPALVVASSPESLQIVVPRLGAGEPTRTVEVRVPGSDNVGQAPLQLQPLAATVGFRFVAEPFSPSAGRSYGAVASDLGPAFVLAASGGRTAAERAAVAADRLNAAAQPLRTTVGLTIEARGIESDPVIGLSGSSETLIEVTEEDARAYNEDWTGLSGRGGPVTRARLARWWEALGRDLVLLTVRGQAPRHAAALAPEGRVLEQLYQAAQQAGGGGVPRRVIDEARPQLRDGLRLIGLRVPPSVTAESQTPTAAAPLAAAATPTPPPLQFDGTWGGSQVEQGQRQYLSVTVRGSGGSVAYEGGITLTVPMLTLEKPRRDQVHFSVQIRGGVRHYAGRWDGEAISGNVSTDAAGKNVVATFELRRR